MKKKSFFLLFLILPIIIICVIPNTQALSPSQDISSAILSRINMEISAGSGKFDSFWDYEKDVYAIEPIITIPTPSEVGEDYAYFESYITVIGNSRIFTGYGWKNTYWSAVSTTVNYEWLHLALDKYWGTPANREHQYYNVQYQDYEFAKHSVYQNYIKAMGYDGYFNVKFTFDDFNKVYGLNTEGEKTIISIPEIYPIKCVVTEAETAEIGEYEDSFGDFGETQITVTAVDTAVPKDSDKSIWGESTQTITDKVNAYLGTNNIGVYATSKPKTFTIDAFDLPLGQPELKYTYRGELTRIEPYIFAMRAKNVPRIEVYEQELWRNHAYFGFDTQGVGRGLRDSDIGTGETLWRQIGWHITEYDQKQTYKITFVAKAKIEASPLELQRLLDHPLVEQGDILWNIALTGNDSANIFLEAGIMEKAFEKVNKWYVWLIVSLIIFSILGFYIYRSPIVQREIGRMEGRKSVGKPDKGFFEKLKEIKLGKLALKRRN